MKIILEKEIEARKIVVSPRPVWKCRACPKYGKTPSCPPHVPSWKETRDWIRCFQTAIIVKFEIGMSDFEGGKREALRYLLEKEKGFLPKAIFLLLPFSQATAICVVNVSLRRAKDARILQTSDLRWMPSESK